MEELPVSRQTFPYQTRILLVEDAPAIREILKSLLRELGFKSIDEAPNGKEGYAALCAAKARGVSYQLVISDLNMPHVSGLELLSLVRNNFSWKSLPFIMLTDHRDHTSIIGAINAGVSGYVLKPVEKEVLSERLANVWRKQLAAMAS